MKTETMMFFHLHVHQNEPYADETLVFSIFENEIEY